MGDKSLQVDNEVHELKLGSSFDPKSKVAFHSIRYDFKPASVDTTQDSTVEVGEGHQITVSVPHVEGAGTDHTVYKGHKRPCLKECVLIIDHQTGTFTLEKLTNNIQLKKTRIEGSSKAALGGRPLTPVDVNRQKNSPVKPKNPPQVSPPSHTNSPSVTPVNLPQDETSKDACPFGLGEISDDSSSYASSSDSDSETEDKPKNPSQEKVAQTGGLFNMPTVSAVVKPRPTQFVSSLSEDLRLSESSSSDSDDD
ncbi:ELL-associated factor 1-like [Mytilus trossulus]|uniref:ELL-associated factor 1-like n=1 Tax=Mytilus trossulus TaxID=6551 RepID=UPI003005BCC0